MAQCPHCRSEIRIYPEQATEDYLQCELCDGYFEIAGLEPVELHGLFLEECPDCYDDLLIPQRMRVGDLIECSSCNKRYELTSEKPLNLRIWKEKA